MNTKKKVIWFLKCQILTVKHLKTTMPLHSVLHKTAYFKIHELLNIKETQKIESFAKEEPGVFIIY